MGLSEILLYARTGAPILSGPNSGNACTYLPSLNAASANNFAAVTTPCWALPCHLTSIYFSIVNPLKYFRYHFFHPSPLQGLRGPCIQCSLPPESPRRYG